jgi:hypothetical protein
MVKQTSATQKELDSMKKITELLAVFVLIGWTLNANATLITKNFAWNGDGGYSATGTIIYDDTLATVFGSDLGSTTGIDYLDITLRNPANAALLTAVDVSGGISTYSQLTVAFDTASMMFTGAFDMGKDDFLLGDGWIAGGIGGFSQMFGRGPQGGTPIDSIANGTTITVTNGTAPAPATLALFGIGLAGLGWSGRKKA